MAHIRAQAKDKSAFNGHRNKRCLPRINLLTSFALQLAEMRRPSQLQTSRYLTAADTILSVCRNSVLVMNQNLWNK
jgi:hypothetical protein